MVPRPTDVGDGFTPGHRVVTFEPAGDAPIAPLVAELDLIGVRRPGRWRYRVPLRPSETGRPHIDRIAGRMRAGVGVRAAYAASSPPPTTTMAGTEAEVVVARLGTRTLPAGRGGAASRGARALGTRTLQARRARGRAGRGRAVAGAGAGRARDAAHRSGRRHRGSGLRAP